MSKEITDLEMAWLQAESLQQDYEMFDDKNLLDCRKIMEERINKIMSLLSPYVREDMSEFELN